MPVKSNLMFITATFQKKQECIPVGCVPRALHYTWGVSVQGLRLRGLCPGGGSVRGEGALSRRRGLCPGGGGSVQGEGALSRGEGALSRGGSVQGEGSVHGGVSVR